MNKISIEEDAKTAWLDLVKRHKKKQRGLPALSTLNTNAGDVEKSIEIFNSMQSTSAVSVDASNGNVSSEGNMCESVNDDAYVYVSYENLPIEVEVQRCSPRSYYNAYHLPEDDYVTRRIKVDWKYRVDPDDIIEVLQEDEDVLEYLGLTPDTPDDIFYKIFKHNIYLIMDKFQDKLKAEFYDEAVEDAEENYVYNPYCESLNTNNTGVLDDKFNMSMRTLL